MLANRSKSSLTITNVRRGRMHRAPPRTHQRPCATDRDTAVDTRGGHRCFYYLFPLSSSHKGRRKRGCGATAQGRRQQGTRPRSGALRQDATPVPFALALPCLRCHTKLYSVV